MIKKILLRVLLVIGLIVLVLFGNLLLFNLWATGVTEGELIENRDPENVALLVIDIQEGTTGSVSFTENYKNQSESLISAVNTMIDEAAMKGWTLVLIKSEVNNPLINILNNTLARGSEGAEFDRRLHTDRGFVVMKRKNDSFDNTELERILEEQGVGQLLISGLDAAHCIKSAIQAALNRGYVVKVAEESVIGENDEIKAQMLDEYREMGVEVFSLDEWPLMHSE